MGADFCKKVIDSKLIKILNADDITEVKMLIQQQKSQSITMPGAAALLYSGAFVQNVAHSYLYTQVMELGQCITTIIKLRQKCALNSVIVS